MEQCRDGIRRGQAGAPSYPQSCAGQTHWHRLAPLPFLPGIEEKALPGVMVLGPRSQERVVENKAYTKLPIERAALE